MPATGGQCKNALEGITVHYQLTDYLVIPEHLALLEHGIYQGSLPMVYMGNDSDISYVMAIVHSLVLGDSYFYPPISYGAPS